MKEHIEEVARELNKLNIPYEMKKCAFDYYTLGANTERKEILKEILKIPVAEILFNSKGSDEKLINGIFDRIKECVKGEKDE